MLTGSIATLVTDLPPEERANVFSVIYATSYVWAAIPTLIAGYFSEQFSLLQVACGYGVLALCGALIVLAAHLLQAQPADNRR
ncbi:hypothetical protein ACET6L_05680 [Aeromonas rivipollensis]